MRRARLDELELSTLRQYEQHLRLHIEPLIGDQPLCNLTPPIVENFKDRLLQSRSRVLSRKVLTSLKGILNGAVRLGYAEHNPAGVVQIRNSRRGGLHPFGKPVCQESTPSKLELRTLLQKSEEMFRLVSNPAATETTYCRGTWWHAFVVLAVFSGMRSSELRGLTWEHVDLQRQLIRIMQRADFQNELGPPKSPAAQRDIPMAPIVFKTMNRWKRSCPESPLSLVFPSRNRRIQTNSNIHKMCWGPLQLAAGVTRVIRQPDGRTALRPRLNFHSLRHAAATLFIEQNWPAKKVQQVMGHSSIQVTYDIYGKLWTDVAQDLVAMAELERSLLGSPTCAE
jgi:integrase